MSSFVNLSVLVLVLCLSISYSIADKISIRQAVKEGVASLYSQCIHQMALMHPLVDSLSKKDLSASIIAYVNARPPYEQIEVLAPSFGSLDRDIDARPYAFDYGEHNKQFRGFHYIERALYRDMRIDESTVAVGHRLQKSVDDLCKALRSQPHRFTPERTFEGATALSYEVPANKVASEEETFSDLSLMIFRNNYKGIYAVISPFLRTGYVKDSTAMKFKKAYHHVGSVLSRIDPKFPFYYNGGKAKSYSKVSISDRRKIIKSAYPLAIAVEHISHDIHSSVSSRAVFVFTAPNPEQIPLASSKAASIKNYKFREEVKKGLIHYYDQCLKQQKSARNLLDVLESPVELWKARRAYVKARLPYEQIEVLAGDFEKLDGNIDQRPYALDRGEIDEGWKGFHLVERALFRDYDRKSAIWATKLVIGDINALCKTLKDGTMGKGQYTAEGHFDGMIALAYEVPAKKISSEEETWSDMSIMIFRENAKGIYVV